MGGPIDPLYVGYVNRRAFLQIASVVFPVLAADQTSDPWPSSDLIQPSELAKRLKSSDGGLHLICVAFPVLYRQRHIAGAVLAGPGSKQEGVEALSRALKQLKPNDEIVLYCGCCPMPQCPNVRPAYAEAKRLGFQKLRVLNLPNNFHTDWTAKGYPVV